MAGNKERIMDSDRTIKCEVIVNGQGAGVIGRWRHISLRIKSLWASGSDGEKFEVLAYILRPGSIFFQICWRKREG